MNKRDLSSRDVAAELERRVVNRYLESVADQVRQGHAVDIPHLGRLRIGSVGAVLFDQSAELLAGCKQPALRLS